MERKDDVNKVSAMTMVLNRVLTYNQVEYIIDYWYGFYQEPIKYSNLAEIINNKLDDILVEKMSE